jgi:hypothetical protein
MSFLVSDSISIESRRSLKINGVMGKTPDGDGKIEGYLSLEYLDTTSR